MDEQSIQVKETPKTRILLIEDDTFLINIYKDKFTLEGFEVLVAEDGETGLKMASEENVSLVVLDLMIPKISGVELLERLRQTGKGTNLPVIVLTNLTEKASQQKVKKLGVSGFIIKADLTPGQLVDRVKKTLGITS